MMKNSFIDSNRGEEYIRRVNTPPVKCERVVEEKPKKSITSTNCFVCDKFYKNHHSLAQHVRMTHNISSKEYYDRYIKKPDEGVCEICGDQTAWRPGKHAIYARICRKPECKKAMKYDGVGRPAGQPGRVWTDEQRQKLTQSLVNKYQTDGPWGFQVGGFSRTWKGYFRPTNPHKYRGNIHHIVYRSRPELILMKRFDTDPNVLEWGSETVVVPYLFKLDNSFHRYFPDFIIKVKTKEGTKTILIEYKPEKQTKPPNKGVRSYKKDMVTYIKNVSKWEAAKRLCEEKNWTFKVLSEKDIGPYV
jgi:hypothetical protein